VGAHCTSERPFAPFDAARSTKTATSLNAAVAVDADRAAMGDAGGPDGILDALVAWYQVHARARTLPGTGCPFAPTCSAYARTALRRYGPLGVILIVDRLIVREHAVAGAYYPTTCVANTTRLVDGVP
jgi:putative component of membrane protein insertase Oxa1/YidC/SpoIIIJ protein YidD